MVAIWQQHRRDIGGQLGVHLSTIHLWRSEKLDEADQACPKCSEHLAEWAEQFEASAAHASLGASFGGPYFAWVIARSFTQAERDMATKNQVSRKTKPEDNIAQLPATSSQAPSQAAREMNDPVRAEQIPPIPVELISELAYQKYLARGERHGSDVQDWLDAEREVASHDKKSRPN